MIRIKAKLDDAGLRRYRANLHQLERVVLATAHMIEGDAKQSILDRRSRGNEYQRGDKIHYAAEPGNAPNSDSGNLAGSVLPVKKGKLSAEIGFGAEYAIPLELGWISKDGKHQGPFPFLRPAVDRHARVFAQAIAAVMKGGR